LTVKRHEEDLLALADEQAALRRIATLLADEAAPAVIFASVAEEIARILIADRCAIGRFAGDDAMTVVAYWSNEEPKVPVGTRIDLQGDGITAAVRESRRPILIHDHEAFSGPLIDYARRLGSLPRSTVVAPIFVEGRVWGSIFASTMAVEISEGTESRLVDFAELVATAIANADARRELEQVAAEQRALRRAATMVAAGAPPMEVFAAITTSASELFEVPFASLLRYGPDEKATMIAGCAACSGFVGQTWTVPGDDPGIVRTVVASRLPARIEDHSRVQGPLGEAARSLGIGSVVGVPVIVDESVWGVLAVGAPEDGPVLPVDAADRLVGFTELVTTTLINAETRDSLRRLADEQAALRRVATLAAAGVEPAELFSAVSEEVARLFEADGAGVGRYEEDGYVVNVGTSESLRSIPVGSRQRIDESLLANDVFRTGRATRKDLRVDDVGDASAYGKMSRQVLTMGINCTVAAPIVVEGELWGLVTVSSSHSTLPPDTEKRLESFSELVATAIANAESRTELAASEARARELANEQAALRRVATLVAQGASPDELFSAVACEVAGIIDIPVVGVHRYEADGTFTMLGVAGETNLTVGSRWPVTEEGLAGMILATGRPARKDDDTSVPGPVGAALGHDLIVWTVGVPIVVEGSIWGFMVAAAEPGRPIPNDTEAQLARFTELVATAVSNATTRTELLTSRARVVSAADETRRRLERDLHDGIQQWLVALALKARKAAAAGESPVQELSGLADALVAVTDELREISRGIHPAILSDSGLDDALAALARRCAIRVDLDVSFLGRYDPTLEATMYYVAAESITNAVKHSQASTVAVRGGLRGDTLELEVKDDGVGGADSGRGTGLIGLKDRVETLSGSISFASPAGAGTTIRVRLPISPRDVEQPPLRRSDEAASAPASG
jgi:signal transduction histidine kinase